MTYHLAIVLLHIHWPDENMLYNKYIVFEIILYVPTCDMVNVLCKLSTYIVIAESVIRTVNDSVCL